MSCCDTPAHKRNVYLQMKSLPEARAALLEAVDWASLRRTETVTAADAVGRVLAGPAIARISSPSYHGAAMDGFALRAVDTFGASDIQPRELVLGEGAFAVNTGDVLPPGCDAVVMIEHAELLPGAIRIEAAVAPWQHVRRVGEDIVATELLFPRFHRVTPTCAGALLAAGLFRVEVLASPRVLIVPTGDEILDPDDVDLDHLVPGTIIDFNTTILGKLVEEHGGVFVRSPRLSDDHRVLSAALLEATRAYDMVLVIGGSSAGSGDYTRASVAETGTVLVHGVTMMPGKPVVLGVVQDRPVVGMPGYPVSSIMAFERLVAPALAALLGVRVPQRPTVKALPSRKIASKLGHDEFVRVRMGRVGEHLVATPLPRGAGTITSFTRADGLLAIAADLEGVHAMEPVEVELLRPPGEIEANVVAIGSHDLCLDLLADLMRAEGAGSTLISSHTGSLGGLLALRQGACHLAGMHLFDPASETWNVSYIARYLPDTPVLRVHLVQREQGLMVARGNPLGITGIADLCRAEVSFVNRQAGSGTRVLLDHVLTQKGIDSAAIRGYDQAEFTHMAVAVAVKSGAADAGLGIQAAARALDLDFVPVTSEPYELIIPEAHFEHPGVQQLLALVRSAAFQDRVRELGGYDTARAGDLVR